ncbi:phenylacetate-CoA oxygenase/reductase subunit PaaK [Rufibacter immobilis]|uniref:Phenylacetate-CoA oxygenase/reductase subunit PaaK n=1 Tax=Rufibacter immobilis TaxID=1348778 RepID=A0A3M9MQJ6_9BACT|nr:1,2-phenylacetyl-CoA epoxidase subunit PaaE [Rufibacter immobilis]RNI27790.1 phenylacetate-CoA oxygenase/reductase subunit PaaK [Rufibacter immobilis]
MSRFHKVRIKSVHRETHDCVTVTLDVPQDLQDTFRYTQGQYLTFRRLHEGEELRRSYSICSSPLENEWKVAIKKVPQGRFSSFANEALRPGEELEVMPPMGRFYTELHPEQQKSYLMVAAGSGITPILSIIKTILLTEPKSQVLLLYGNRGRNSIMFKEEIEGLKNKFLERFSLYHILSREHGDTDLLFGRIDKQKTQLFLEKIIKAEEVDECFICGPEEMIFGAKEALEEAGVPRENIHFELFTTGESEKAAAQRKERPAGEEDKLSKVQIKLDGHYLNLEMSYYGNTILDAAAETGADVPYSCKGGVCSTCRAKVLEGQVEMDVNYSLEPDEIAAGYVLTCQARPLTERVVVDFDQ